MEYKSPTFLKPSVKERDKKFGYQVYLFISPRNELKSPNKSTFSSHFYLQHALRTPKPREWNTIHHTIINIHIKAHKPTQSK